MANNLCPKCKIRESKTNGYCRECYNKLTLEYYHKHKIEINKRRKEIYAKNIGNYKTKKDAWNKDYHRKFRIQCLIHYGGNPPKCACCGETIIEFLTIDHINNGGCQHRKKVGLGWRFYQWLVKNNFPEGYQVLCMNCNWGKRFSKVCPHKLVVLVDG